MPGGKIFPGALLLQPDTPPPIISLSLPPFSSHAPLTANDWAGEVQ